MPSHPSYNHINEFIDEASYWGRYKYQE
jgi:hypothetical protein